MSENLSEFRTKSQDISRKIIRPKYDVQNKTLPKVLGFERSFQRENHRCTKRFPLP